MNWNKILFRTIFLTFCVLTLLPAQTILELYNKKMGITVELDSCQGAFPVGIMDERGYGTYQDKKGIFHVKLSRDSQSILKLVAQTSAPSEEKVMWSTQKTYYIRWKERAEVFPVVNPASYTIGSTGTAYTMFGPQPFRSWFTIDEKGNYWGVAPGDTVTIYAKWRDKVECTEIVLE